jgi:hypothetical protein
MKTQATAKTEPDKMSGAPERLHDEALAKEFLQQYGVIGRGIEELRPLYAELRRRFFKRTQLNSAGTIMGCKTWTEFCQTHLKYSDRHVRRLIEGDNPATKKQGLKAETVALPKPTQSLPANPPPDTANWTDNTYVRRCIDFIVSTLRPLESDPQRFSKVALDITNEITRKRSTVHEGFIEQDSPLAVLQ